MTALLAILISGVLLDANDKPMPKYQLAFTSADGKLIKVTTDENGKFKIDLAPGIYRFENQSINVAKNTSTLKLIHRSVPRVIQIFQGDVILPQ